MAKSLTELKAEIDQLLSKRELIDDLIIKIAPLKTLKDRLADIPTDANQITIESIEDTHDRVEAGIKDILSIMRSSGLLSQSSVKAPAKAKKQGRGPNRSAEQKAYDEALLQTAKAVKETLQLPSRGRLKEADQVKFDEALAKEITKRKLTPPASAA